MFEEVEVNTNLYILGQVTKGNKPSFLKFEVWIRVEETDTEITRLMTQQQLADLQQTFLWERAVAEDSQQEPSLEDILLAEADDKLAEAKIREH
jgi:hypothetical protein